MSAKSLPKFNSLAIECDIIIDMSYARKFVPPNAKLLPPQAKRVFQGEIFDVYQWPQEMYDGSVATFEMLSRADTVEAIGIKDGKIVITKQIQPRQNWHYAYPGGRADPTDTDELATVKREMLEESGMTFRNWKLIKVHQPQPKIDWLVYLFIAWDLIGQTDQKLDAGEKIEVLEISFEELKEYANKPNAKYLNPSFFEKINSIDELLELPSLYNYEQF